MPHAHGKMDTDEGVRYHTMTKMPCVSPAGALRAPLGISRALLRVKPAPCSVAA